MEPLEQPQQHTATLRAGDYRVLVGLVLFAFFLRMLVASLLPFPSLDDPALYYTTAAHLAEGRGLVSDVIWSHLVTFDSVSHPSNEHWMPLTVFVLAAAFVVAGTSLSIAQAVGALLGGAGRLPRMAHRGAMPLPPRKAGVGARSLPARW